MSGAFLAGVAAGYGIAVPVGAIGVLIAGLSARTSLRVGAAESAAGWFRVHIPAGPLSGSVEARRIGPAVAAAHFGTFTGHWTTVVPGEMSVVEVEFPIPVSGATEYTMDVPAGPLEDNDDARAKCPAVCRSHGGTWNGQWRTVVPGKLSVAGCVFRL